MNANKTISGILALTASLMIGQSVRGADVLFPPKAESFQTRQVSGIANDRDWVHGSAQRTLQSPRAQSSQTRAISSASAKDQDLVHNQDALRVGKDPLRDQYIRLLNSLAKDSPQLTHVK